MNGIYFGDNGELYIQTGSNTNGGVPGPLSGSHLQKENYFSSATIVAELSDPLFQGIITYDKEDDGRPCGTTGIDIFAPGIRNGYSVVLHSNGYLYGTDNGPNSGYGKILSDRVYFVVTVNMISFKFNYLHYTFFVKGKC